MLVQELGPRTNPNMASDLKTAMALARAAVESALANVEINLDALGVESARLPASEATGVAAFIAEGRAAVSGLRTLLPAK
jgi:formiminotetrahydrofolate cyclodeaminase